MPGPLLGDFPSPELGRISPNFAKEHQSPVNRTTSFSVPCLLFPDCASLEQPVGVTKPTSSYTAGAGHRPPPVFGTQKTPSAHLLFLRAQTLWCWPDKPSPASTALFGATTRTCHSRVLWTEGPSLYSNRTFMRTNLFLAVLAFHLNSGEGLVGSSPGWLLEEGEREGGLQGGH